MSDDLPTLIYALYKPSMFARMAAISALKQVGEPAVPHLIDPLASTHDALRVDVAKLLSEIQVTDPQIASQIGPALIDALHDFYDPVRWYAIIALGKIGEAFQNLAAPAVPTLIDMLDEDQKPHPSADQTIAQAAAQALGRIGTADAQQAVDTWLLDQEW